METIEKKTDRRVVRTKKAIKNAFARLLAEKDINNITVSDIAEYADVNRKTFYNYYAGVYEVVDEIENDIVGRVDAALGDVGSADIGEPYTVFEKLTAVINTDMDFFGALLSMNGNVSLMTKIVELVKEKTRAVLKNTLDEDDSHISVILDFTISGMMAVYQRWFNSDRHESIEDISKLIEKMCRNGLDGLK